MVGDEIEDLWTSWDGRRWREGGHRGWRQSCWALSSAGEHGSKSLLFHPSWLSSIPSLRRLYQVCCNRPTHFVQVAGDFEFARRKITSLEPNHHVHLHHRQQRLSCIPALKRNQEIPTRCDYRCEVRLGRFIESRQWTKTRDYRAATAFDQAEVRRTNESNRIRGSRLTRVVFSSTFWNKTFSRSST
jgi:hypothetical protein